MSNGGDNIRKLMESLDAIVMTDDISDDYDWGEVFVYDSYEGEISEVNLKNELEFARFDHKYGFDSDSLFDFPVERGVRHFVIYDENPPRQVFVSPDLQALAAEIESRQ